MRTPSPNPTHEKLSEFKNYQVFFLGVLSFVMCLIPLRASHTISEPLFNIILWSSLVGVCCLAIHSGKCATILLTTVCGICTGYATVFLSPLGAVSAGVLCLGSMYTAGRYATTDSLPMDEVRKLYLNNLLWSCGINLAICLVRRILGYV